MHKLNIYYKVYEIFIILFSFVRVSVWSVTVRDDILLREGFVRVI